VICHRTRSAQLARLDGPIRPGPARGQWTGRLFVLLRDIASSRALSPRRGSRRPRDVTVGRPQRTTPCDFITCAVCKRDAARPAADQAKYIEFTNFKKVRWGVLGYFVLFCYGVWLGSVPGWFVLCYDVCVLGWFCFCFVLFGCFLLFVCFFVCLLFL